MAAKYGVYWRTAEQTYWTLALGLDHAGDAEQLKCRIMGMPRGRYKVERTTVIDFPEGGDLPVFVHVGKEREAPQLVQHRSYTPNWKPETKGRAKASSAPARQPAARPVDDWLDSP